MSDKHPGRTLPTGCRASKDKPAGKLDRTLDAAEQLVLDKSAEALTLAGATEAEIAAELEHQLEVLAAWREQTERELERFCAGAPRRLQ